MSRIRKDNDGALGVIYLKDIIREVAHRTGITRARADIIVREVFIVMKYYIFKRMNIEIPRFGSFYLVKLKAKLFNLPSGEKVWKDERLQCKFSISTLFRKAMLKIKLDKINIENDIDDVIL